MLTATASLRQSTGRSGNSDSILSTDPMIPSPDIHRFRKDAFSDLLQLRPEHFESAGPRRLADLSRVRSGNKKYPRYLAARRPDGLTVIENAHEYMNTAVSQLDWRLERRFVP